MTASWHDNLKTFGDVAEWQADLKPLSGDVVEDDEPTFDATLDPEVDTHVRLSGDRALTRTPTRRLYHDYRANPDAYRHLDHLPTEDGVDLEMLISGKYAMWELVPALIEKTGQRINHLHIATLSFSKQNAADLLGLLDDGHVGGVSLIVSYYFKSTSRPIYDALIPQLLERGQRVRAIRNHAKIILARMEDDTRYNIRGSPNLRSSVNIERLTLSRGADIYGFDLAWMEGEILNGVELGTE